MNGRNRESVMTAYVDRRDFVLGVVALSAAALKGGPANAAGDPGLLAQPWAVWDTAEKPVRGGYLRTASEQYIGKMNPNHWPVLDWLTINDFYEKLLISDGSYRPTVPWLVDSVAFEDPTTAVTKLRGGITFQDGSKLDAAAVKSLIDWIRDPKSGAWSVSWLAPLDTVEAVDDLTVRWRFKHPWAAFPGIIANVPGYMVSPTAIQNDPDKCDNHPVGTGAYILEEASPGNFVKVKRNPNWWFAKASGNPDMPYFDGVVITIIPDPAVRLANLRAGKIDLLLAVDKSQYAGIKNDTALNVYVQPLNWLNALRFNCTKGACQDLRVRKAISHAIDRRALIVGTQFGLAREASCMYPEDHWAHNPDLKPVAYDPGLAKSLLAEAGHADGLTLRGFYTNTTQGQTVAEAIKNMLAHVGVTWNVEMLAPVAATQRLKDTDYDLAEGGWSWIYDPDLMASGLYMPDGGFNFGRSNNKDAIALIEAGRHEVDPAKRQQTYWQLEKILYDDYEDAWLWWEENIVAMRKSLRGWNQEQIVKYKEAWSWSHPLWFKDGKSDSV
jgi:peptide/nickel transport system substrate-binding protein